MAQLIKLPINLGNTLHFNINHHTILPISTCLYLYLHTFVDLLLTYIFLGLLGCFLLRETFIKGILGKLATFWTCMNTLLGFGWSGDLI